jgi:hypothetical protein
LVVVVVCGVELVLVAGLDVGVEEPDFPPHAESAAPLASTAASFSMAVRGVLFMGRARSTAPGLLARPP